MPRSSRRSLFLMIVAVLGCASGGGSSSDARSIGRSNRDVLTVDDLRATGSMNAYDAVAALRSSWLRPRGPDSFSNPGQVWAYVNDVRVGGVDTLRRIPITEITYIRYFDGTAASARWGLGHSHGVVFVSTRPERD